MKNKTVALYLEKLKNSIPLEKYKHSIEYYNSINADAEKITDCEFLIANSHLVDGYFTGGDFTFIEYVLNCPFDSIDCSKRLVYYSTPYISKIIKGTKYYLTKPLYVGPRGINTIQYNFKEQLIKDSVAKNLCIEYKLELITRYYEPLIVWSCPGLPYEIRKSVVPRLEKIQGNINYLHLGRTVESQKYLEKQKDTAEALGYFAMQEFERKEFGKDGLYRDENQWTKEDLNEYYGYERDYDGDLE